MKIVCISDTHKYNPPIPDGDVLVHAGDFCGRGELDEIAGFDQWMAGLPHKHKVVIAGNHDIALQKEAVEAEALLQSCTYLRDSGVEIDGIKFWGVPWTPNYFPEHWSFNHASPGEHCQMVWDRVPEGTDVIVSHGPPFGHLDLTKSGNRAGCSIMLEAIERVKPRLVVCGHIHEGYGAKYLPGGAALINASICTTRPLRPSNAPFIFNLD